MSSDIVAVGERGPDAVVLRIFRIRSILDVYICPYWHKILGRIPYQYQYKSAGYRVR